MPPSGRRNSTLPLSHGEAVRFHGSIASASPSKARAGLAVEANASPGAVLITPSRGSPTTVVALPLDALRQCRYAAAELRRLLDRRPGRKARPQAHADVVLLLARLPQESEGAAEIRVAGEHRQEAGADVLQLHRRMPAALDD